MTYIIDTIYDIFPIYFIGLIFLPTDIFNYVIKTIYSSWFLECIITKLFCYEKKDENEKILNNIRLMKVLMVTLIVTFVRNYL